MDPYPLDEYSSSEAEENESLSSDDELINKMKRWHSNDVEIDEFEKEMNEELEQVISSYQNATDAGAISLDVPDLPCSNDNNASKCVQNQKKDSDPNATEPESGQSDGLYDESYFSSGSEDDVDEVGGEKSKSTERRRVPTNDELLYDPNMDDDDEQWMNKQRRHYRQAQKRASTSSSGKSQKSQEEAVPNSDAILTCPACMTTLCIDCQRHELYKMQFRAMFVLNCTISRNEVLKYDEPKTKGNLRNKKQKGTGKLVEATQPSSESDTTDIYHPVKCTECGTEVAVFDKDEIYHFFNVIESLA